MRRATAWRSGEGTLLGVDVTPSWWGGLKSEERAYWATVVVGWCEGLEHVGFCVTRHGISLVTELRALRESDSDTRLLLRARRELETRAASWLTSLEALFLLRAPEDPA